MKKKIEDLDLKGLGTLYDDENEIPKPRIRIKHNNPKPTNADIIIIENKIKVYKDHFCHCPCGKRIPVGKYHFDSGIPKYINGHFMKLAFLLAHEKEREQDVIKIKKNRSNTHINPKKA